MPQRPPILPLRASNASMTLSINVMGNSASAHRKRPPGPGRPRRAATESLGRLFNLPPSHVVFTSGRAPSRTTSRSGARSAGSRRPFIGSSPAPGQGKVITSTGRTRRDHDQGILRSLSECMGAPVGWLAASIARASWISRSSKTSSRTERKLISVHHAHNEIGVLQDIAARSRPRSLQAARLRSSTSTPSRSFHESSYRHGGARRRHARASAVYKIGGPKGIGALVLGRRFETRSPKIGPAHPADPRSSTGFARARFPCRCDPALHHCRDRMGTEELRSQLRLDLLRRSWKHLDIRSACQKTRGRQQPVDRIRRLSNPRRAPQTLNFSDSGTAVGRSPSRALCPSAGILRLGGRGLPLDEPQAQRDRSWRWESASRAGAFRQCA